MLRQSQLVVSWGQKNKRAALTGPKLACRRTNQDRKTRLHASRPAGHLGNRVDTRCTHLQELSLARILALWSACQHTLERCVVKHASLGGEGSDLCLVYFREFHPSQDPGVAPQRH